MIAIKVIALLLMIIGFLLFQSLYFQSKPITESFLLLINAIIGGIIGGLAVHLYDIYKARHQR